MLSQLRARMHLYDFNASWEDIIELTSWYTLQFLHLSYLVSSHLLHSILFSSKISVLILHQVIISYVLINHLFPIRIYRHARRLLSQCKCRHLQFCPSLKALFDCHCALFTCCFPRLFWFHIPHVCRLSWICTTWNTLFLAVICVSKAKSVKCLSYYATAIGLTYIAIGLLSGLYMVYLQMAVNEIPSTVASAHDHFLYMSILIVILGMAMSGWASLIAEKRFNLTGSLLRSAQTSVALLALGAIITFLLLGADASTRIDRIRPILNWLPTGCCRLDSGRKKIQVKPNRKAHAPLFSHSSARASWAQNRACS